MPVFADRKNDGFEKGTKAVLTRMLTNTALVTGVVAAAAGLTTTGALADCYRDGNTVTCATSGTDGFFGTIYEPGVDLTVNISADVNVNTGTAFPIEMANGGSITVNHTAGAVTSGSNHSSSGFVLETDGGDITGTFGDVTGTAFGIYASGGNVDLTANGKIDAGWDGIYVYEADDVTITNTGGEGAGITGGDNGIYVLYSDDIDITNDNARITGGTDNHPDFTLAGIAILDGSGSLAISNRKGAISAEVGVSAWWIGGPVTISNHEGSIAGEGDYGIDIYDVGGPLTISNHQGSISGGGAGISAYVIDDAVTISNREGSISGDGNYGVDIYDISGPLTISNQKGSISSEGYGISAWDVGGSVTISNQGGSISGNGYDGIDITRYYIHASEKTSLDNTGGSISGAVRAIHIDSGTVEIVNGGALDEDDAFQNGWIIGGNDEAEPVIDIVSDGYDDATEEGGAHIVNNAGGIIGGRAILPPDPADELMLEAAVNHVAIQAKGGRVQVDNYGTLVGQLHLTEENDVFSNFDTGNWTVSGENDFGAGENKVYNSGRISLVDDTSFVNLGDFYNHENGAVKSGGTLDMSNKDASGFLSLSGNYHGGEDSHLRVDAHLDAGGTSDRLHIEGQADGSTSIHVNNLNRNGAVYDPNGILVVTVSGGAENSDNFTLAGGPVASGFFSYDLFHESGSDEDSWYLRSYANDYAGQVADLGLAALQLWHHSLPVLTDRTTELRRWARSGEMELPLLGIGTEAQSEAVGLAMIDRLSGNGAGSAPNTAAPGIWGSAFGTNADWNGVNQRSWGFQAGVDAPLSVTENGAFIVGALAGYVQSDLDLRADNSDGRLSGPTLGAYASYVGGPLYINALVKADFLSIDYGMSGTRGETDGISLGAQAEAGYRIEVTQRAYVEPRASLAYVRTDIDDLDMMSNTVSFGDGDSLQGMFGLRVGTMVGDGGMLIAPYVTADIGNEFRGGFAAGIESGGPAIGISDEVSGMFGQVGLGVDLLQLECKASAFAKTSYRFGEDFDSFSGTMGIRIGW